MVLAVERLQVALLDDARQQLVAHGQQQQQQEGEHHLDVGKRREADDAHDEQL